MSEENKAFVRRWVETLNQENWAERVIDFLPTPADAAGFIDMHTPFRTAFPDYHFTIDEGDTHVRTNIFTLSAGEAIHPCRS